MAISKKIKNSTFLKYFLYVSVPALIMVVFMIFNIAYSISNHEKMLKNNYSTYLSSVCTQSEALLQSVAQPISNLENDSVFLSVVTGKANDAESIKSAQKKLAELEKNNVVTDSIIIVNRSDKTVITKNGTYNMRTFFNNKYIYKNYDYNHWNEYRSTLEKRYFSPTEVYPDYGSKKLILPLTFSKINTTYMNNLVIVNINLAKLLDNVQNSETAQNATLGVVNRYAKTFYTNATNFSENFGDSFFKILYTEQNVTFNYSVDGKKCFVTAYSPKKSILGYTYAAIIPYNKITEAVMPTVYVSVLLFILAVLLLSLMAYFSARQIYTPIEKLASILPREQSDRNLIEQLHDSITELLETSTDSPGNTPASTLPYAQEHLIVNMLNSEENSAVPHLDEIRSQHLLDFEHDRFCAVVVSLCFSDTFYDSYNVVDYNSIISNLYNIIQLCFSEKFNTFVLPSQTNTLYLLLNLSEENSEEEINGTITYIKSLLEYDNAYINANFAVGGIQKDLSGLKASHHNALRSVNLNTSNSGVNLENSNSSAVPTYIFTVSDEENLKNLLLTGKTDKASELIDEITDKNINGNVPDSSIMQMYAQILGIVFNVMQTKHIEYDADNVGDHTLISKAVSFSMINARKAIASYLDIIDLPPAAPGQKIDINAVIGYIDSHYQKELFLDKLAEVFGTTPKYLSKLIKSHLGVTFLAYLTNLRINKAKELLDTTDKTVNEIYIEVGFNNRNSFSSTFKKTVGITPSEYKRLSREKNVPEED